MDVCSILVVFLISFKLTGIEDLVNIKSIHPSLAVYVVLHIGIFTVFKCYSSLWRYAGDEEMISIVSASLVYVLSGLFLHMVLRIKYSLLFYIVNTIFIIAFTGGIRLVYRTGRKIAGRQYLKE